MSLERSNRELCFFALCSMRLLRSLKDNFAFVCIVTLALVGIVTNKGEGGCKAIYRKNFFKS